jgi:hypothetical protein
MEAAVSDVMPQIETIVFLMLENRSLDSTLGWLYDGTEPRHVYPERYPKSFESTRSRTSKPSCSARVSSTTRVARTERDRIVIAEPVVLAVDRPRLPIAQAVEQRGRVVEPEHFVDLDTERRTAKGKRAVRVGLGGHRREPRVGHREVSSETVEDRELLAATTVDEFVAELRRRSSGPDVPQAGSPT